MSKSDICYMAVDGRLTEANAVERLCEIGDRAKDKFGFGEVVVLSARSPKNSPLHTKVTTIRPLNYLQYSQFVFSQIHLHTEKKFVLIYQDDGFALNPDNWTDEFLNYDYIGAPWPKYFPWSKDGTDVGNGGFSLRSRKLIEFCSRLPYPMGAAEDMVICGFYRNRIKDAGFTFAPFDLARRFSCEWPIDATHTISSSFGFHGKHNLHLVNTHD